MDELDELDSELLLELDSDELDELSDELDELIELLLEDD